jgi:AcrR family transcriptional regulator
MPQKSRAYHHGDLRAALLEAAMQLLAEHGPAGFSLREAARACGVDAAACYRHFRDRQEVLFAVAQLGFKRLAERFEKDSSRHHKKGAAAVARAFARSYLALALEQPAVFRVMFGESGTSARDPRLRLPELERTAYEQLEAVAGNAGLANVWWAYAHGVTRLIIDGALPLNERESLALMEKGLDILLR